MEEFGHRKTGRMQTYRQAATEHQDAVYFSQSRDHTSGFANSSACDYNLYSSA